MNLPESTSNTEEKWLYIHRNGREKYPKSFSVDLTEAWNDCTLKKIPYDVSSLPVMSNTNIEYFKKRNIKIYAYTNRTVSLVIPDEQPDNLAICLFSADGVLIRMFGCDDASESESGTGDFKIPLLSDFSMGSVGANAVSIGLSKGKSCSTVGIENYASCLIDKAIYFSPIVSENNDGDASLVLGGIAIITPVQYADSNLQLLCNAITYDINLHLFMSGSIERAYSSEEKGLLHIDFNIRTSKTFIIYHDRNLFKILDVPPRDYYFHPVEELIDPLPANKNFWSMVQSFELVNNIPMLLTIGGREVPLLISTDPYFQPRLKIRGMRIFFTSTLFLSQKISKSIGNSATYSFSDIIGKSLVLDTALRNAKRFADTNKNVLITGESGTGKGLFAQAIHNGGPRSDKPFLTVNCASIPREQLSRELFGCENPVTHLIESIGKLELANDGTIYLKDIEAIPLPLQSALQVAIEERQFKRINGNSAIVLTARIIASTEMDLAKLSSERKFRADLYYRLDALKLTLPPLRDRKQDIPLLADYFINSINKTEGKNRKLSPAAKSLLSRFRWDGNIRELQNVVESVALLSISSMIEPEEIISYIGKPKDVNKEEIVSSRRGKLSPAEIEKALLESKYNKKKAAELLGISRRTLYRYIENAENDLGTSEE